MSEKILVEVYVPAARATFDVFVPVTLRVHEATKLIAAMLNGLTEGKLVTDQNSALCERQSGKMLNINMRVSELGMMNGSKLMLI